MAYLLTIQSPKAIKCFNSVFHAGRQLASIAGKCVSGFEIIFLQ